MSFSTREYEIMRFIQNTPYCRYCDVLNSDLDRINETNQLLKHLISAGTVSVSDKISPETSIVKLTPDGLSSLLLYTERLLAAEREAMKKAAEDAERKADAERAEAKRIEERTQDRADEERRYHGANKVTIISALLSFIAGVLVEHWAGIFGALAGIFF